MTSEELLGALSPLEQVNAPKHLFLSGDGSLLSSGPRVAIVGTGTPTVDALCVAGEFAVDLVERGVIVVSGVMPGVDNAAHIGAIDAGGRTIAVLATSINECFPSDNYELHYEIMSENLVVSQFPEVTRVSWGSRVKRSQTMALISHATIIIQAEANSEAVEQGMEALRLRRPLFIAEQAFEGPDSSWVKTLIDRGASMLAFSTFHRVWNSIGLTAKIGDRA